MKPIIAPMFTDIIIMAGGSGTRLWPASNSGLPKQFLPLPGGGTFFGASLERAFYLLETDNPGPSGATGATGMAGTAGKVVVVAGASHVAHVLRECKKLSPARRGRVVVIPEPVARNTAPAVACAAVYLERSAGAGRRALILTSDHIIGPLDRFRDDAEAADKAAALGKLVVFGIPPRNPETGFGYLEAGAALDFASVTGTARIFKLDSFHEKPDRATAESYVASGKFYWNSGMFGFSVDAMLWEFRRSSPETLAPFETLRTPTQDESQNQDGICLLDRWKGLSEAYTTVKPISIDYAVAEKTRDAAMVAAGFDWIDIGSWDDYAQYMEHTQQTSRSPAPDTAVPAAAPVFNSESTNCWVDSDLPVALCGVEDLIVVVRSGADGSPASVLVCRRGESQKVKNIVDLIKADGRPDLL